MTFQNCQKFRRSFTTSGIGYTFNNDIADKIFKNPNTINTKIFMINAKSTPTKMESSSPDSPLEVILENNMEEVDSFETTKTTSIPIGDLGQKPRKVKIVLHNPYEPANIRSNSFEIPLGNNIFTSWFQTKYF